MTVTLVVVVTAGLWLALWWEDRAWKRNHPPHTETPSRLDSLDGINPPADPPAYLLPPEAAVERSAGAPDGWQP
jgi:hypothetical protein